MPNITTSQPQSLIDAIKRQAEREGVTVSQWVGAACLARLQKQGKKIDDKRRKAGRPAK